MTKRRSAALLIVALSLVCAGQISSLSAKPNPKPQDGPQVFVTQSKAVLSPPLRTMPLAPPHVGPTQVRDIEHIPLHQVPAPFPFIDQVRQNAPLPLVNTVDEMNFDALKFNGWVPPDSNGAIGATQYMTSINIELAVFDKATGALLYGPVTENTFFNALGAPCNNSNPPDGSGDPIAQYDKIADRWVVSNPNFFETPYYQCIAVSQTSDATGAWYLYAFQWPDDTSDFPDYPKQGTWPDAYYVTANDFEGGFIGPEVCAYNRAEMLLGNPAAEQCFTPHNSSLNQANSTLLPGDVDGTILPPSGEPEFLMGIGPNSTDNRLQEYKFHVDWSVPSNSTLTGPTYISVANYTTTCGGGGGACVPEKGGTLLDALGDRIMYRLPYRNFGDHEVLLATHTVTSGSVYGVRWYEIHDPNGSPTVYQSGTFQPDNNYRWVPSIAMDQSQDIAVGYSVSSSSIYPQIAYTGRVPSDPLGSLESEDLVYSSVGGNGTNRWGDYTSMTLDPADDCTFWYINEYMGSTGETDNWVNRVNSFVFNGCGGVQQPYFTVSASPGSQSVQQGQSTSYTATITPQNGFIGNVTMSLSGLPSGATDNYVPNPVDITNTSPQTTTLTVNTGTGAPGTYTLNILGTSGSLHNSATVGLTITAGATLSFSPTSLGYGNQVENTTSAAKTETVTNNGPGSVSFTSVASNNSDYAITSNTCTGSLNSGQKCKVNVTFTPTKLGADNGGLVFTDSGAGSPQTVNMTGNGVLVVTLNPTSASFGNVAEGTPSTVHNFTLTNNQAGALTITSITTGNPDYTETDTCDGSLAAHSHCTISVTLTPTHLGPDNGTLTVNDNASNSPQTASLTGTGVVPATLTPSSSNFGTVKVGHTSTRTFTLHNNAAGSISFSGWTITGLNSGDYSVMSTTCTSSLGGHASCSATVQFAPTATGTRSATLNANDSASNSPQQSSMTGTGN